MSYKKLPPEEQEAFRLMRARCEKREPNLVVARRIHMRVLRLDPNSPDDESRFSQMEKEVEDEK